MDSIINGALLFFAFFSFCGMMSDERQDTRESFSRCFQILIVALAIINFARYVL